MKPAFFRWLLLAAIFGYTVLVRLLPYLLGELGFQVDPTSMAYPWSFSPALAVFLLTAVVIRDRLLAVSLPLLLWLAGDLGIWAITGRIEWAFYPGQGAVYGSVVLCTLLGFALRKQHGPWRVASAGLASCLVYFLVTNFFHWLMMDTYPHSFAGLVQCYVAALPFFRNLPLGTAVFLPLLFSPPVLRALTVQEPVPARQAVRS